MFWVRFDRKISGERKRRDWHSDSESVARWWRKTLPQLRWVARNRENSGQGPVSSLHAGR